MKRLISLFIAFTFLLSLIPLQPAVAHTESAPYKTDLLAGQTTDVGDVLVWNDKTNLYVKYAVDEPWCLAETHLHIAPDWKQVPQTKTKNPIPGKFQHKDTFDPCVPDKLYTIPLNGWNVGTNLYIAAHAVVKKYETRCQEAGYEEKTIMLTSDIGDNVWGPIYADPQGNIDPSFGWGNVNSAVEAVNNISDPRWVWGKGNSYNPNYDPDIEGVKWISTASDSENWIVDSWRLYKKEFAIPTGAINMQGSVIVNADNEYWAYFNGTQIGYDNDIWNALKTHSFAPTIGVNSLSFIVKNWAQGGSQVNNPNGLTYKAEITYNMPVLNCYDELVAIETAWGNGTRFTPKGNWGMYFAYTIQEEQKKWVLFDTFVVPATTAIPTSSNKALESGIQYKIEVVGTYNFRNPGNSQGYLADAEWALRNDAYGTGWTKGDGPPYSSPYNGLDLCFDANVNTDWGALDATTHTYSLNHVGGGSVISLFIKDNQYGDNSGFLTVNIYSWE